jgi:uncharacterized lipoprotein YehR (DUF1307 family)
MSNVSKMNISTVYEMFEEINKKLDKQADNTVEPVQVNMTAIDAVTERLEKIEEVRIPKSSINTGIRLTSAPTGFSFHGWH